MSTAPASPPLDARRRIVVAGAQVVVKRGVADASMSAIASAADVSKALLHYHFRDRDDLLAEVARLLGRRVVTRERATLKDVDAAGAVDALWRWADDELRRGELRALLLLGAERSDAMRSATNEVNALRRASSLDAVEGLLARLGVTVRVPVALVADTYRAFVDGLAIDAGQGDRDPRVAFDVLWLALLTLGD